MASKRKMGPRGARDLDLDSPPMESLSKIFDHLARRALGKGLEAVLRGRFDGHTIGVATMCSGTESPLFALQMITEALSELDLRLAWDHHFSAEIVPFKQAFIERNFHPRILFRDVTKLESGVKCETAYGAPAEIPAPGKVQILVAGFSCVDFSMLNGIRRGFELDISDDSPLVDTIKKVEKKESANVRKAGKTPKSNASEEQADTANPGKASKRPSGESSATFSAIYRYAKDFRPTIIILENVQGAFWEEIAAAWEKIEYAAAFKANFDTKDYYLPHTRQRGYMVCVNYGGPSACIDKLAAEKSAFNSIKMMEALARRASSSVEAFMLDQDSVMLQKAMREAAVIASRAKARNEISWVACEERYASYRKTELLGEGNPYTNWRSGRLAVPYYSDSAYIRAQTDRVKDTFDIMYLEAASQGYDFEYKSRFPDVSQNVDRNLLTAPQGITGCITPSGQIYSTYRGGPLVGLEALALQGLPIDKIHLTRETQKDLQDLAGNAMTSTVVGAAILSALICAHDAIPTEFLDHDTVPPKLPAPLPPSTELMWVQKPRFEPKTQVSLSSLKEMAGRSAQMCPCEGQQDITSAQILICKDCKVTVCQKHSLNPKHNFVESDLTYDSRLKPGDFELTLRDALPLRLTLDLDLGTFENVSGANRLEHWQVFSEAIRGAFGEDLFYESINRSRNWKVTYRSSRMRLHFVLDSQKSQWELFIDAPNNEPSNSIVREILREPVAVMTPLTESNDVLVGKWILRLPDDLDTYVRLIGEGDKIPSWQKELGLRSHQGDLVYKSLRLSLAKTVRPDVSEPLEGVYDLLPRCGTSERQLHKKRTSPGIHEDDVYLFSDPTRVGQLDGDCMILSKDHRRLNFSDARIVLARLTTPKSLGFYEQSKELKVETTSTVPWRPKGEDKVFVGCSVHGPWQASQAALKVSRATDTFVHLPNALGVHRILEETECNHGGLHVLHGTMPWHNPDPDGLFRGGTWIFNESSGGTMRSFADWFISAVPHPIRDAQSWIDFKDESIRTCNSCAPARPGIKWIAIVKGKTCNLKPVEDFGQTPAYETEYKNRPSPIDLVVTVDRSRQDKPVGGLIAKINPVALLHRTVALFPQNQRAIQDPECQWRLTTQLSRKVGIPSLRPFTFSSTSKEPRTEFEFHAGETVYPLRPDQQKELTWILCRDGRDASPFTERIVEEAKCPALGAALEVKAQRKVLVRGGILADEVGFGKTVQILALVQATQKDAEAEASEDVPYGKIGSKATVIFVPSTLMPQWEEEIKKFWPQCSVISLADASKLKSYTIRDIQKADIILASHKSLRADANLKRLAALSSLPEAPNMGQVRQIASWLDTACERLSENTDGLMKTTKVRQWPNVLRDRIKLFELDDDNYGAIPSKRLRGDAFQKHQEKLRKQRAASQAKKSGDTSVATETQKTEASGEKRPGTDSYDIKILGFEKAKDYRYVKWPVMEMFRFHRIVVDEHTYVEPADLEALKHIESLSKWCLSATTAVKEFEDVRKLAEFLGVYIGYSDLSRVYTSESHLHTRISGMTDAEQFEALIKDPSDGYFVHRQDIANDFIDHFVRSNRITGGTMMGSVEILPVIPTALERAILVETMALLASDAFKYDKYFDPDVTNPRDQRLQNYLGSSNKNPQQALLLATSYDIDYTNEGSGYDDMASLIKTPAKELDARNKAISAVSDELLNALRVVLETRASGVFDDFLPLPMSIFEAWCYPSAQYDMDPVAREIHKGLYFTATRLFHRNGPLDRSRLPEDLMEWTTETYRYAYDLVGHLQKAVNARHYSESVQKIHRVLRSARRNEQVSCDCGCIAIPSKTVVNVSCGHTFCLPHHEYRQSRGLDFCGYDTCRRKTSPASFATGVDLACFENKEKQLDGSKFDAIAELILETEESDQVILFVQFQALAEKLDTVLNHLGISTVSAHNSLFQNRRALKAQEVFTNFRNSKFGEERWRKALIINPTDSSAAGHNLVNAHIAIFVSPILCESTDTWADFYRQSIGRIRRPGQTKPFKVYHFVTLDTMEVNVMEEGIGDELRLDGNVLRGAKKYGITKRRAAASLADMCERAAKKGRDMVMHKPLRVNWASETYKKVDWA